MVLIRYNDQDPDLIQKSLHNPILLQCHYIPLFDTVAAFQVIFCPSGFINKVPARVDRLLALHLKNKHETAASASHVLEI